MKVIKKILKIIENIILTIIFVISIAFIVSRPLGIESFVVMSGSMEPTIHTGSIVFVNTKTKYESIGLNDIVVFNAGNDTIIDGGIPNKSMRVIHRIVKEVKDDNDSNNGNSNSNDGNATSSIGESQYITKGDNNENNDGVTVTRDTFVGKELFSIPSLGYAIEFMNKYNLKFAIFAFIDLILIFELIFNFIIKGNDDDNINNNNNKNNNDDEEGKNRKNSDDNDGNNG